MIIFLGKDFTVWDNSAGYGKSSLTEALEYIEEKYGKCTFKGIKIINTQTIELG